MGAPNKRQLAALKSFRDRRMVSLASEQGKFVQLFETPDGQWGRVNGVKCDPASKKELAELMDIEKWEQNGVVLLELTEEGKDLMKVLQEECGKFPGEIPGSTRIFNTLMIEDVDKLVSVYGKRLGLVKEKGDLGRSQVTETALGAQPRLNKLRDAAVEFNNHLAICARAELNLPLPSGGESYASILETESSETEAQQQHVDVTHEFELYGYGGNGHFLTLSSINGDARLRCLPGSHRAQSLGELDKCSSCWRRFIDVPIPDGYFLVIHPLIVHAGSKTASSHSRVRRIHGYHGWSHDSREAKSELTYKVDANISPCTFVIRS